LTKLYSDLMIILKNSHWSFWGTWKSKVFGNHWLSSRCACKAKLAGNREPCKLSLLLRSVLGYEKCLKIIFSVLQPVFQIHSWGSYPSGKNNKFISNFSLFRGIKGAVLYSFHATPLNLPSSLT